MKREDRSAHDRWAKKLPDIEPGTITHKLYEDGRQCGSCKSFRELSGTLGLDWGVCANRESQYDGRVVFEHFTCTLHKNGGWK